MNRQDAKNAKNTKGFETRFCISSWRSWRLGVNDWYGMADDLTFLMGKFPAVLPGGLRYARNHMWARPEDGKLRFGFTSYAVRLMQDVYFLDWQVNPGDRVELLQQIGHIETSKAVSDLFAPRGGAVVAFNPALLDDPSGINVDGYGTGWLFDMDSAGDDLLSVQEYHQFLDENWEKTQRMIKGKINTED
jgi:glycine cleavage system H protein